MRCFEFFRQLYRVLVFYGEYSRVAVKFEN